MHLIVAQNVGWDITYIGNSVPNDEISYAASRVKAQVVILAINNSRDIARKIYMKLNISEIMPKNRRYNIDRFSV